MARAVEAPSSPPGARLSADRQADPEDEGRDVTEELRKPDKPPSVDPAAARFPYCVVWTPIPIVTWLVPFIGHMGVCTSEGVILDFAGPYFVSVDNLAFGRAARYMWMPPGKAVFMDGGDHTGSAVARQWDLALQETARVYQQSMYNFCGNNCHEFVAHFLNSMHYRGSTHWNMVKLAAMVFFKARFVSIGALLWSWLPFVLIAVPTLYFGRWIAAAVYGGVVGLFLAWFILYSTAKALWSPRLRR